MIVVVNAVLVAALLLLAVAFPGQAWAINCDSAISAQETLRGQADAAAHRAIDDVSRHDWAKAVNDKEEGIWALNQELAMLQVQQELRCPASDSDDFYAVELAVKGEIEALKGLLQ